MVVGLDCDLGVEELNARADRKHVRRALTLEEGRKLLTAAETAPLHHGMSGAGRALVYRLALETGLRAGEIASLTRASFDLAGDPPTVTIAAASAKSRREKAIPLRSSTAQALQGALREKLPSARAFHVHALRHSARTSLDGHSHAGPLHALVPGR